MGTNKLVAKIHQGWQYELIAHLDGSALNYKMSYSILGPNQKLMKQPLPFFLFNDTTYNNSSNEVCPKLSCHNLKISFWFTHFQKYLVLPKLKKLKTNLALIQLKNWTPSERMSIGLGLGQLYGYC
jgi:hypothetical protein